MSGNLFAWSDDTWKMLDQGGILVGYFTLLVPFAFAAFGYFKRTAIRRWFTRNRFPDVGAYDVGGITWDGIVFTVSHEETPLWVMTQLRPKTVAFVASKQSLAVAEKLKMAATDRGIAASVSVSVNADVSAEVRNATAGLLADMKQSGLETLAVDITGGKTPMSLGAFMAAEEAGAASLYVASKFDSGLNKPDMSSASIRIVSMPE